MTFVVWEPSMSVGSETLDGHHRMIIDSCNRLHPLLDQGGHQDEVKAVVARLEDYVLVHFSEEEQAMRKAGYPGWKEHKALHDRMYDVVFALKADIENGRDVDARRLFDLIYDWLVRHILGEDRTYVPYLAAPHPENATDWHRANGRPY